jgi:hypothetical protein
VGVKATVGLQNDVSHVMEKTGTVERRGARIGQEAEGITSSRKRGRGKRSFLTNEVQVRAEVHE